MVLMIAPVYEPSAESAAVTASRTTLDGCRAAEERHEARAAVAGRGPCSGRARARRPRWRSRARRRVESRRPPPARVSLDAATLELVQDRSAPAPRRVPWLWVSCSASARRRGSRDARSARSTRRSRHRRAVLGEHRPHLGDRERRARRRRHDEPIDALVAFGARLVARLVVAARSTAAAGRPRGRPQSARPRRAPAGWRRLGRSTGWRRASSCVTRLRSPCGSSFGGSASGVRSRRRYARAATISASDSASTSGALVFVAHRLDRVRVGTTPASRRGWSRGAAHGRYETGRGGRLSCRSSRLLPRSRRRHRSGPAPLLRRDGLDVGDRRRQRRGRPAGRCRASRGSSSRCRR